MNTATVQAAATGISLLLQLIDQAARVSGVIRQAQAEGRNVTSAELAQLVAENDVARLSLVAAIDQGDAYALAGQGTGGPETGKTAADNDQVGNALATEGEGLCWGRDVTHFIVSNPGRRAFHSREQEDATRGQSENGDARRVHRRTGH